MDHQETQHSHVENMVVKLHYSESLIRRAVRAFWWRATGALYWLAILLILVSFCFALWRGDHSWWVGALGACFAIVIIFTFSAYVAYLSNALARFRKMRVPEATIELGDERFRVTSDVGTSELDWSTVIEISRYPDVWLLFFSRAQYITLPAADLSTEAREFILAKTKSCGAKVV